MQIKIEINKENIVDFFEFYNIRTRLSDEAIEALAGYYEGLNDEISTNDIDNWDDIYAEVDEDDFINDYKHLAYDEDDTDIEEIMEKLSRQSFVIKTDIDTYIVEK